MDQETLVRKHSNEFKNITNLLLKKYPDIEMIFFYLTSEVKQSLTTMITHYLLVLKVLMIYMILMCI